MSSTRVVNDIDPLISHTLRTALLDNLLESPLMRRLTSRKNECFLEIIMSYS